VAFLIFYIVSACMLLAGYFRRINGADSLARKPARWVVFLIALLLISTFSSVVASFSPRNRLFSQLWTLIASTGASGMYVLLTYHVIRRKYLLYTIRKAIKTENRKSGRRRMHAGKLTRERLENLFREEKPYLNSAFKITDVVEAMDVNRSVISAFINREYGMNFNRYVNRLRLEEAKRLAEQSGVDASRLWAQAGFSEARQYHRAIRNYGLK
jgi:AraC-like DNA-binding protein